MKIFEKLSPHNDNGSERIDSIDPDTGLDRNYYNEISHWLTFAGNIIEVIENEYDDPDIKHKALLSKLKEYFRTNQIKTYSDLYPATDNNKAKVARLDQLAITINNGTYDSIEELVTIINEFKDLIYGPSSDAFKTTFKYIKGQNLLLSITKPRN